MTMISTGVSGITTAQLSLQATANNISNVNTPGYNRERTLMAENSTGGVRVEGVQRQFNQFVNNQLNGAVEQTSALTIYNDQIGQIDRMLADPDVGISPIVQGFFSSIRDLASAPSDSAARQGVLGTAGTMAAQFRAFDRQLESTRQAINGEIEVEVKQINTLTSQIAELNNEIGVTRARTGTEPNSLLNSRDRMVAELSERLGTRLYVQDGGSYNISLPDGQALVAGDIHYEVEAIDSSSDPLRTVLGYRDSAGNLQEIGEDRVKGGKVGGLMAFRTEVLDEVQNKLGQLVASLAGSMNEQHAAGVDLNGDPGADIFSFAGPAVFENANNVGTAAIITAFSDVNDLKGIDYELRVTDAAAGEFQVRGKDGSVQTLTLDGANQMTFDGVELTVPVPGDLVDGDKFLLMPTRFSASNLEVEIDDVAKIAAGQGAGTGDNRNALALQDLQSQNIVNNEASFNQAYAGLVGDVGNRSNVAQTRLEVQSGLTDQVRAVQQSESGVNLDEEAANLVRFQQYYQANAKVVEVATSLIDTILGLRI